jgi:hypothetical protein
MPAAFGSIKIRTEKLEISQLSANLDTSSAIPCEVSLIRQPKPRRFTVKAMAKLGLGSFFPIECVIEVRVASADTKT